MKYLSATILIFILVSCNNSQHSYTGEQVASYKKDFEIYVKEKNEYCKSDDSPLLKEDIPGFDRFALL